MTKPAKRLDGESNQLSLFDLLKREQEEWRAEPSEGCSNTGKPIEGAVVVAQWTNTRGIPGLQYHNLHKIVETLTDKNGAFSLSGTSGFIINPPDMIIYKEGYLPWRNGSIFPDKNLEKKEWDNNVTYKLDVFTDKYTVVQLRNYINSGIIGFSDVPIFHMIHNKISDRATDYIESKKTMNHP